MLPTSSIGIRLPGFGRTKTLGGEAIVECSYRPVLSPNLSETIRNNSSSTEIKRSCLIAIPTLLQACLTSFNSICKRFANLEILTSETSLLRSRISVQISNARRILSSYLISKLVFFPPTSGMRHALHTHSSSSASTPRSRDN